jgi:hypothetical protein
LEVAEVVAVCLAAAVVQATWLSSPLLYRLGRIPSRLEQVEQGEGRAAAEVLAINHDSLRLESTSVLLEVVEGQHKGLLRAMAGAVAVGLRVQRVQVELLELGLQRV